MHLTDIFYAAVLPTLILRCISPHETNIIVTSSSGTMRGFRTRDPESVAFLGIPFAKPPVGRLRFRMPEPVDRWKGVLNATQFANACYQYVDPSKFPGDAMVNPTTGVSENCLYLNVWAPVPRPVNAPVMVWLHGGLFLRGSTSMDMYNGKYLAAGEMVVVVSIAYRLGILGFFYLGHDSAPGNQGLHDQVMGLRWVHDNIVKFGGDPNRVTLFGSDAGATSISLHLLSPLSDGLFHRAIMQSGVTGPAGAGFQTETAAEAKSRALLYAFEFLECPRTEDPLAITDCLRDMTADELVYDQLFPHTHMIFLPCVDAIFLTALPVDVLENGYIKKRPVIIGTVKNEGSLFVFKYAPEYVNHTHRTMNGKQFDVIMRRIFTFYPNYPIRAKRELQDKLIELYGDRDHPTDTARNLAALDAVYSDAYFVCAMNEYARAYSGRGEDVYVFHMTQRYERNPWPQWMGVVHGDDVYFVFGAAPAPELDLADEELLLSKAMKTYWANFARTGNPNAPISDETLGVWPKYKETDGWSYLDLNLQYFSHDGSNINGVKKELRLTECAALHHALTNVDEGQSISSASQTIASLAAIISQLLLSNSLTLQPSCISV